MLRVRLFASCLLALLAGETGAAAEAEGRFRFRVYGPEQGFKDAAVNALAQDARGFLWIGTETGLLRYDGSQVRKWGHAEGLPESRVIRVLPDLGGGVWAVMRGEGAALLRDGKFIKPLLNGQALSPIPCALVQDWEGRAWMLRQDGLYRQSAGEHFQRVGDAPPCRRPVFTASPTRRSLMAICEGSLLEWWPQRGGWELRANLGSFPEHGVDTFLEDGSGRLWLVGEQNLAYLDAGPELRMASKFLPAPAYAGAELSRDALGRVWIPTNKGLLWVRGEEHGVIDQAWGLPHSWFNAALMDREGNLWAASASLSRMLDRGYLRSFRELDGLPSDLVWSLLRDRRGRLWVGTNSGLAWLGSGGWVRVAGTEGLTITSMAEDAQGRLWLANSGHAPLVLAPGAPRPGPAPLGIKTPLQGLYRDRSGFLWFGLQDSGELTRVSPRGDALFPEILPGGLVKGKLEVQAFAEDAQGRLWLASNQGLLVREQGAWRRWTQQDGLKATALDGLALAPDGGLWVYYAEPLGATKLQLQEGRLKVLEQLNAPGRLPSDLVYAVGEDAQGNRWVSTDQGLVRLGAKGDFRIGRGADRVPDEGNGGALLVEENGDVWMGTTRGLLHVLAKQEPPPLPSPLASILRVSWGGKSSSEGGPPGGGIPKAEATLEFRFAASTYVDESAVVYQVRLVGLEDAWRTTDVQQARYPSLPSGTYRFEVRAAYPGEPFGPSAVFAFHVERAWWESWWTIAAGVIGLGLIIHTWVRWRLRRLAATKERLEADVFERTQALRRSNDALQEANRALESQSLTDPLTGLHNRRFLSLVIENEATQVLRVYREESMGEPLGNRDLIFFMVDLDHFKLLNDRFGHGVGDHVLQATAQAIKRTARESDAVIRMGGEEFLILARNFSRAEAPLVAERLRNAIAQECLRHGEEVIHWTASIGFAAYPFQTSDLEWANWERVTEIADACLYAAKKSGRNAWVGIEARPGLSRVEHGARIPWEMGSLLDEGVLEAISNRKDPFGRKSGEVFG